MQCPVSQELFVTYSVEGRRNMTCEVSLMCMCGSVLLSVEHVRVCIMPVQMCLIDS